MMNTLISKVNSLAQWFGVSSPTPNSSLTSADSILNKIISVGNFLTSFAVVICVALIVYGGFQYITSAGDAEKVESGTKTMTNAIIGLVIILISALIIRFIVNSVLNGFS